MADELYNKMRKTNDRFKESILLNKENYKKRSAERLKKIIEKKITTIMIGSISDCEKYLGDLWGHGKHHSELTKNEKEWSKIWNDNVRNSILNRGNSQFRALEKELDAYEVEWLRNEMTLPVIPKEE